MKRLLLLAFIGMLAISSSAQKYQDPLLYGENKNRIDVYTLLGIPNDTFSIPSSPQDKRRKPHLAAKGNTLYLWDTTAYKWNAFIGGSGSSADSTLFATLYRMDTMRANLYQQLGLKLNTLDTSGKWIGIGWLANLMKYSDTASKTWDWSDITGKPTLLAPADTANKYITTMYRKSGTDSVFFVKGGAHTFAFKDSVGSGGGSFTVDSIRYNSATSTITLYQTGASDLSTYINSSYLLFDSTFSPLGGSVNDSTAKVKSIRMQLNGSTITPTVTDSTASWNVQALVAADTASLSNRINQKLNISDTTSKTWDWGDVTGKPTTLSGYGITDAIDSLRRVGGSTNVEARKNGVWITQFTDSVGSGGGGSPAGNYGNVQLNRNGAFATPASDSLDFDAGLAIKGTLSATALPTGGVAADSVVVVNSAGALKKRNSSAFVTTNGSTATGQFALFNGSGTVYSSSKFNYSDATYPTMSIIGSDPLIYIGPSATLTNNAAFGSGAGAAIYGGATYKSVQFVDQISGGTQMARFYNSGGTLYNNLNGLIISNTLSSPSNYQGSFTIQRTVPYAVTGLNYHGFTDQTDFRVGTNSFNSFGSFVTIGNNRTSQGHFAAFQSVWYKDSSNRLQAIYDFVSAVSEARAGTIDSLYRFKVFEATNTGATIVKQYGIQIDNLTAATTNVGAWIYNNVGIGPTAHTPSERLTVDGNGLFTGTITTGSSGSGAGAWKLGVRVASSGLTLDDTQYIEISIGGTVYKLALVNVP